MKALILLIIVVAIVYGGWATSNCNNNTISPLKQYQAGYCFCKSPMHKVQGSQNESKCVTPHNDSLTPCTAYDHCSAPEQCVRQNGSFACAYVQAGCYEFIDVDMTVKQKCI